MDEYGISTNQKPIIGTHCLGPCISFVLHSPENKIAIVGHVSKGNLDNDLDLKIVADKVKNLIKNNNLTNKNFNLILVEGGQKNEKIEGYNINILMNLVQKKFDPIEVLCENLKQIESINIINIRKANETTDDIQVLDFFGNLIETPNNESSKQFMFNANTGKFVSSNVFYFDEDKKNIRNKI